MLISRSHTVSRAIIVNSCYLQRDFVMWVEKKHVEEQQKGQGSESGKIGLYETRKWGCTNAQNYRTETYKGTDTLG